MTDFTERQKELRKDLSNILNNEFGGVTATLAQKLGIAPNSLDDFLKGRRQGDKTKEIFMRATNYKKTIEALKDFNFIFNLSNMVSLTGIFKNIKQKEQCGHTYISEYRPADSSKLQLIDLFLYGGNLQEYNRENPEFTVGQDDKKQSKFQALLDDKYYFEGLLDVVNKDYDNELDRHKKISSYSEVLLELNEQYKCYIYDCSIPSYLLGSEKEKQVKAQFLYIVYNPHSEIRQKDFNGLLPEQQSYCQKYNFNPQGDFFLGKLTDLQPLLMTK